ncbi:hypothetical protein NX059_002367 [Plenodomus lindquistii]|nr:hypothetical protein NX059_002367 [Plenodomus lindquistii]
MWESSVLEDICWYIVEQPRARPNRPVPSWSWASAVGPQFWLGLNWSLMFQVIATRFTLTGPIDIGAVTDASVILKGPVKTVTLDSTVLLISDKRKLSKKLYKVFLSSHSHLLYAADHGSFYPDFDFGSAEPQFGKCQIITALFVGKLGSTWAAMILRPTGSNSDEFERIGIMFFDLTWQQSERKAKPFAEFASSLPSTTVKIR